MKEDELQALVALCTKKKAELRLTNVVIADMSRFSSSSVDRFFRGEMKRPTWEFIRAMAQILDIPTQEIREIAPNMREGFRGDPLPPQDGEHIASAQDMRDLVDTYREMIRHRDAEFSHTLSAIEDDFAEAMASLKATHADSIKELREQHRQEIAASKKVSKYLFCTCCVLTAVLVAVLWFF